MPFDPNYEEMTGLPVFDGVLSDADALLMLQMAPVPRTKLVRVEKLRDAFINRAASAPASFDAAGNQDEFCVSGNYLYLHNGTQWLRMPLPPNGSWVADYNLKPKRAGSSAVTTGTTTQTVTFATPFASGSAPVVKFSMSNVASGDKLLLFGMVVAASLSGFTVILNAQPDSTDYYINYEATQL